MFQKNYNAGIKYRGGMAMLFDWNARVLVVDSKLNWKSSNYFALNVSPVPFYTGGF